MDTLSEALKTVRMTSAIFFNAEFTAPWGFSSPPAEEIAPTVAPDTDCLVIYHLVTEGRALARIAAGGGSEAAEEAAISLAAGDMVIVPHGDAHTLSNGSPARLIDTGASLSKIMSGDLNAIHLGGGGDRTHFICGFFGCERGAGRLFLAGLPPLLKVSIRGDATGRWLENSIQHLVSESGSERSGRTALLSKMSEALFIETLRRYLDQLPPEQTGWLPAQQTRSSAARLPCCIEGRLIPGRWPSWPSRSAHHARSSPSASPATSANRR